MRTTLFAHGVGISATSAIFTTSGVLYQSALTGFIKSTYTTTLIFGNKVRQELTKRPDFGKGA